MVHSLELLLDEASDLQIRGDWAALAAVGLPNQGAIRSGTNRPHVTLFAAGHINPDADAALTPACLRLPVTMTIGAPVLFAHRSRTTLARLVVPSTELLSVHAQTIRLVADHLGDSEPAMMAHTAPGHWTPHVTLARRLEPEQLARALTLLDIRSAIEGSFVALRHWNGDAKTESVLGGRAC